MTLGDPAPLAALPMRGFRGAARGRRQPNGGSPVSKARKSKPAAKRSTASITTVPDEAAIQPAAAPGSEEGDRDTQATAADTGGKTAARRSKPVTEISRRTTRAQGAKPPGK